MTGSDAVGAVPGVEELTRVVALDGPAGSGKSTVARRTAQALGWRFVDTGATYRAVTLHVLRTGVSLDDAAEVARVAAQARVEIDVDPASTLVRLNGDDVTSVIRGPEVTAAVSAVSAVPAVRTQLVQLQRRLMGTEGAVVEGRDIATVVAPRAGLKVYLDAREEVRARRRAGDGHNGVAASSGDISTGGDGSTSRAADQSGRASDRDLPGGGESGSLRAAARPAESQLVIERVRDDLRRRDELDNQTNKLEVSEGAIHLDTSDLTLDEVVAAVVELVRAAGLAPEVRKR